MVVKTFVIDPMRKIVSEDGTAVEELLILPKDKNEIKRVRRRKPFQVNRSIDNNTSSVRPQNLIPERSLYQIKIQLETAYL